MDSLTNCSEIFDFEMFSIYTFTKVSSLLCHMHNLRLQKKNSFYLSCSKVTLHLGQLHYTTFYLIADVED